jgi:O-acetyl-ADP-ribose deacetylase
MAEYLGCSGCKHFKWNNSTCKAFPQRIPLPIISGEIHHITRLRWQDNDVIYEPILESTEVKVPEQVALPN